MFNIGDKIKVKHVGLGHKPYITQVFTVIYASHEYITCTTEDYVDAKSIHENYTFDENDCYLYYMYDINLIIADLEKLEKKYER